MPNIVNRMVVREYTDMFADEANLLVVSFHGLDMVENEMVRSRLAEKGAPLRMVRNKLARRVLAERGVELDAESHTGNTAICWGEPEAVIGAAKVFTDKEIKKLKIKIKGGVLDGQALNAAEAVQLADVPDKDTLRGMLLGVISGPARSLASVINAVPSSVARVIQAHADEGGE